MKLDGPSDYFKFESRSNQMVFKHLIIIVSFLALISSCGLLKEGRKVVDVRFEYDESTAVNYGRDFSFRTYAIQANGKEKDITSKEELNVECYGANYENGRIFIDGYPERFSKDLITIRAQYEKEGTIFKKELTIPFNYQSAIEANFSGTQGEVGGDGSDGGTALLFRWGKDGDSGYSGGLGGNGSDLHVHIWKDPESKKYKMIIEELESGHTYYYSFFEKGHGVSISANGGAGGRGGNGGKGGDGKDYEKTEKKTKSAGDGGHGGDGGTGGQGGTGGSIYVFIHPNAMDIQEKLGLYNFGGPGGDGGSGGQAGSGGSAPEGQTAGENGQAGNSGDQGPLGESGTTIEISIQEFEF